MKNAPPATTDGADERRFQYSGVLLDTTSDVVNRFPADHVFSGLRRNDYRCVAVDAPTAFLAGTKGRPQHYDRMSDHQIATPGKRVRVGMFGAMKSPNFHG
jgi:hypothetical protein